MKNAYCVHAMTSDYPELNWLEGKQSGSVFHSKRVEALSLGSTPTCEAIV